MHMDLYHRAQEILEDVSGGNLKWVILIPTGAYLFYRVIRWCYIETQLPPGPIGWPWLGYTRCLGDDAFKELQRLHHKYGPVVSFRLCGKLVIVLNDVDSIKEAALKRRTLIGRHTMLTNHVLAKGFGITNYDGENAAFARRIFVRAINQFLPKSVADMHTDGKSTDDANLLVDSDLDSECSKVVDFLRQKNGEPVKISSVLRRLSWNVLWKATFGTNCKLDDDTIADLIECIAANNADNGPLQLKQMFPNCWSWVFAHSKLARRGVGMDGMCMRYERVTSALRQALSEVLSNPNRPKNCLVSQLVDNGEGELTLGNAHQMLFELMAAGVDTAGLTLTWCCDAIATGKLTVPPDEVFNESHLEVVHRLASTVPLAMPHRARFDSRVCGYYVPKDSVVIFNIFGVHQAQLKAQIPEGSASGCPQKQTDNPQPKVYFCESAIPFSLGPRACPGFTYATRLITRIMTHLNANFDIKECDKMATKVDGYRGGLTRPPTDQRFRFIPLVKTRE